jgi:hypothetical protein
VLALILFTIAAGQQGPTEAAAGGFQARPPDLQLGGGAFTLHLNTGWFGARPAAPESKAAAFDVAADLDLRARRGRLRLGGGDERRLRLSIQWDVDMDRDMARVHSQIDLALFGRALTLSPPDVRVRPRFDSGIVDVSVPLIEGHF